MINVLRNALLFNTARVDGLILFQAVFFTRDLWSSPRKDGRHEIRFGERGWHCSRAPASLRSSWSRGRVVWSDQPSCTTQAPKSAQSACIQSVYLTRLIRTCPADTLAGRRRAAQKQAKVHDRLTLLMQIDEDTSAPCVNELPALIAPDTRFQRLSDDLLVRPSASDTFPGLSHFIDSLPPTTQRFIEEDNETRQIRPPAQSMGEMWCQFVEDAHNFSMDNVDRKVLETAHQKLRSTPQSGKSPYSQMIRFEELLSESVDSRTLFPLSSDHLLSLIYYNVFRALVSNMRLLNLDLELMETDDYQSPFLELDSGTCSIDLSSIPPDFQPTLIQRTVPHHPRMDIFPDPVVRDNIILNQGKFEDYPFCMAVIGHDTWYENDPSQRAGMVVWGEPWNVKSWEITDGFVAKWQWMLKGAEKLENATNSWRRRRGLRPLAFGRQSSSSMIKPGCMRVPEKDYANPEVLPC